jgi:hypothetical protein
LIVFKRYKGKTGDFKSYRQEAFLHLFFLPKIMSFSRRNYFSIYIYMCVCVCVCVWIRNIQLFLESEYSNTSIYKEDAFPEFHLCIK